MLYYLSSVRPIYHERLKRDPVSLILVVGRRFVSCSGIGRREYKARVGSVHMQQARTKWQLRLHQSGVSESSRRFFRAFSQVGSNKVYWSE